MTQKERRKIVRRQKTRRADDRATVLKVASAVLNEATIQKVLDDKTRIKLLDFFIEMV